MTASKRTKHPAALRNEPMVLTPFAMDALRPMLGAAVAWNGRLGSTIASFNGEWFRFVGRRLEKDMAMIERCSSCQSPHELWSTYSDFIFEAASDYRSEMAKLARVGNKAAAEGATAAQSAFQHWSAAD